MENEIWKDCVVWFKEKFNINLVNKTILNHLSNCNKHNKLYHGYKIIIE